MTYGILSTINILLKSEAISSNQQQSAAESSNQQQPAATSSKEQQPAATSSREQQSAAISSREQQSAAPKSIDTINNNSFYQIYNTPYRGIAVSLI